MYTQRRTYNSRITAVVRPSLCMHCKDDSLYLNNSYRTSLLSLTRISTGSFTFHPPFLTCVLTHIYLHAIPNAAEIRRNYQHLLYLPCPPWLGALMVPSQVFLYLPRAVQCRPRRLPSPWIRAVAVVAGARYFRYQPSRRRLLHRGKNPEASPAPAGSWCSVADAAPRSIRCWFIVPSRAGTFLINTHRPVAMMAP